jgi:hypothetical protein
VPLSNSGRMCGSLMLAVVLISCRKRSAPRTAGNVVAAGQGGANAVGQRGQRWLDREEGKPRQLVGRPLTTLRHHGRMGQPLGRAADWARTPPIAVPLPSHAA